MSLICIRYNSYNLYLLSWSENPPTSWSVGGKTTTLIDRRMRWIRFPINTTAYCSPVRLEFFPEVAVWVTAALRESAPFSASGTSSVIILATFMTTVTWWTDIHRLRPIPPSGSLPATSAIFRLRLFGVISDRQATQSPAMKQLLSPPPPALSVWTLAGPNWSPTAVISAGVLYRSGRILASCRGRRHRWPPQ